MLNSQDLGLVLVALIGVIGSVFGTKAGRDKLTKPGAQPQSAGEMVEIRGAIVSDKAVDKMVAAFETLTLAVDKDVEAKGKLTVALNESGRRLDRNSDVSEEMRDDIREVNRTMEGLKAEFIRAGVHK